MLLELSETSFGELFFFLESNKEKRELIAKYMETQTQHSRLYVVFTFSAKNELFSLQSCISFLF